MPDSTPYSDTGVRPPRVPRWVKVSAIVVIALVVIFVGVMLIGGGGHKGGPGPGQHGAVGARVA